MPVRRIEPSEGFHAELPYRSVQIHILSDVHIGAREHDARLFQTALDEIASSRTNRCILNGDLWEAVIPGGRISIRDQIIHEMERQAEVAMDLLWPIRGQILFARPGNHENRTIQRAEADLVYLMCKQLGIPYYNGAGMARISWLSGTAVLAGSHGVSTAKNGDLELERMRRIYDADVYYAGHNHQNYSKMMPTLRADENGSEHLRRQWFVRAGSFLRYAGYARDALLEIQRCGWPIISLRQDGSIHCESRS